MTTLINTSLESSKNILNGLILATNDFSSTQFRAYNCEICQLISERQHHFISSINNKIIPAETLVINRVLGMNAETAAKHNRKTKATAIISFFTQLYNNLTNKPDKPELG